MSETNLAPELVRRAAMFGEAENVAALQASLVDAVFADHPFPTAPVFQMNKLPMLQAQKEIDPQAYGPIDFAQDTYDALWGDLSSAPQWRRTLQRAYLDRVAAMFAQEKAPDRAGREKVKAELTKAGYTVSFAASIVASEAETVFPAWARDMLPNLAGRLTEAAAFSNRRMAVLPGTFCPQQLPACRTFSTRNSTTSGIL